MLLRGMRLSRTSASGTAVLRRTTTARPRMLSFFSSSPPACSSHATATAIDTSSDTAAESTNTTTTTSVSTAAPATAAAVKPLQPRFQGNVKFFDPEKGFGFIRRPEAEDIFIHASGIRGAGKGLWQRLVRGAGVEFEIEGNAGRLCAVDLTYKNGTPVAAQPAPPRDPETGMYINENRRGW